MNTRNDDQVTIDKPEAQKPDLAELGARNCSADPVVGDKYYKPPGYAAANDGGIVATPPHHAEVIEVKPESVTLIVDGIPWAASRNEFAYMVEKTLAAGAIFIPQNTSVTCPAKRG